MDAKRLDVKEIFCAAIEKKTAAEQNAYLDEACGDDKKLREEVEELLKAHYAAGHSFLRSPPGGTNSTLDAGPLSEGPGTRIGRYKLLQLIGEGGFGVVYMAEQEEPIRRRVALKIIKLGMDTKQVIARFEAERQALAMMDHPNIARVLDAGATDTGRPYFVMELVKGIPITEYCDKNSLDTRQRLELFIDVCKAVQHAHQKGIIHRDIKPSNVMITLHDGKPVSKIIDFGIAKATQQRLTEKTVFTEYQQFIGTPEYMSPEQAEMSGLDVDTRTDIYSLGVLLYELLTGTTPFEAEELRIAAYDEIRRIIREDEPSKPSTRLKTLGDTLADIAKHRSVQPSELRRIVRGDLDWVVMKALEKDRTRRYETANELAQDIGRHLGDEPVIAGPPSTVYRLRKFARRNRTTVTAVAVVLAAIVAGLVVSTTLYFQAELAREKESAARVMAEQAREKEAAARTEAVAARDVAEQAESIAQQQRLRAQRLLARSQIERGAKLLGDGDGVGLLDLLDARMTAEEIPDLRDSAARLWAIAYELWSGRLVHVLPGANNLAFSPEGRLLATVNDQTARLWDTATGEPHSPLLPLVEDKIISAVLFSPDGKLLATHSVEGATRLWDTATGKPVSPILRQDDGTRKLSKLHWGLIRAYWSAAFSPDGKLLATASLDGTVQLWETDTGQTYGEPLRHETGVWAVAFSPDGKLLASGSENGIVQLWEIAIGQPHGTPLRHRGRVMKVEFSPDGKLLAILAHAHQIDSLWKTDTGKLHTRLQHLFYSDDLAFSPDGKLLATATTSDRAAWLWDTVTGKPHGKRLPHEHFVRAVAFSRDQRLLASGSADQTVRLWEVASGQSYGQPLRHQASVLSVAFSPGGKLLASSGGEMTRIWRTYQPHRTEVVLRQSGTTLGAISPDGKVGAIISGKTVHLWDTTTIKALGEPLSHDSHVHGVAFSPDGKLLAVGTEDWLARVFEVAAGRTLHTLPCDGEIYSAAFSPNGKVLATGSKDGMAKLWDVEKGKVLKDLINHEEMVQALAFSSDGMFLASGSYDNTARIWEVSTGRQLTVLEGHSEMVSVVAFSPDGKRLVTASRNTVAKIWDVKTGRELITFSFAMCRDPSLAISPDGRLIAVGQGHDAVILPAFPWREQDYPGDSSMSLDERIELYKRDHWKQQAQKVQVKSVPFEQANPMQQKQMLLESLVTQTRELGPEHPDTLSSLDRLLDLYEARGKWTVGLLEKLVAEFPDAPALRSRLATDLAELGCRLERLNYRQKANEAFDRAEAVCKELLQLYTRAIETNPEDAGAYLRRGNVYLIGLKQYDEAVLDYSAAIELYQARGESIVEHLDKLVSDFPNVPEYRARLAKSYNELGDLLKAGGRLEEAEQAYQKAREIEKEVVAEEEE